MAFLDETGLQQYTTKVKEYVNKQITNAIGDVTSLSYQVVTDLPEIGAVGVIYLKALTDVSEDNIYDEFIWVDGKYEYLGTTKTDLQGYATEQWVKDQKYLTAVPSEYITNTQLEEKGYLTSHQDISGKQDVIQDLEEIRSGATAGSTAVQPGDDLQTSVLTIGTTSITEEQLTALLALLNVTPNE